MYSIWAIGTLVSFHAICTTAYTWPSPKLDALEAARFDQLGDNAVSAELTSFIQPCDLFLLPGNTGRSNAADWIRTAYHDMATHNAADGTGGLDASIRFPDEQRRPENAGDGFQNTMSIVPLGLTNRYVSVADSIALAALLAIENCGGPEIPFRGGRIDATKPNLPGVPQPQQDLNSHIASFARQGFTPTEMIGLVACGHSFGGVQHDFFPDIVGNLHDPNSTLNVADFDSTFFQFDNKIATEYISGTTKNPLVIGKNHTTNSDKRIFSSDGNSTMHTFANSPGLFASTCADLFARMLDTVPSNVQLTEVLSPLPVKPSVQLILDGDIIQLSGQVRLWNMTEDPTRTVRMRWHDHHGGIGNATLSFTGTSSSTGGKYAAAWYAFNASDPENSLSLDAHSGVKSLSFVVNDQLEDQDGLGFAIQDGFMFSATSCLVMHPFTGRFDVAVRNGVNPTRVYLEEISADDTQKVTVTEIDISPPTSPVFGHSGYSLWSINLTNPTTVYSIGAEIEGVKYSTTDEHLLIEFPLCSGAL
ncbi:peroxidase [Favolaschia claudopus]|uniref:Peroxidase n=1 Tax=Favolaschia claudopus TaxID=2862362 RepID=A0AAW0AX73_9AGAR